MNISMDQTATYTALSWKPHMHMDQERLLPRESKISSLKMNKWVDQKRDELGSSEQKGRRR